MAKNQPAVRTPAAQLVVERSMELMSAIPDAGGDGLGILTDILESSATDLVGQEDSGTIPVETLMGHNLRIESVRKVASDEKYIGDDTVVPFFVVMEGQDLDTGEKFVTTTSGTTVILKMAVLCRDGVLPATVVLSESNTRAGWTVQNCAVVAITESVNA